ncbi:hypothetical protein [Sodalis sp. RH22]|uniref:hypothetical protein n=1 Tax=unclassified Sodalis (in: enterobacteria) TaxID=2636512 RepID=UPI0039B491E2
MSYDQETKKDEKPSIPRFGVIEKAWEWQWALKFSCVVLFVDIALLLREHHGLLFWTDESLNLWRDFGFRVAAAMSFCLLASIGFPTIFAVFQGIAWKLISSFPKTFGYEFREPFYGEVPAERVRKLALRQHDEFLMRRYEEHQRNRQQVNEERRTIGGLVASVMFLSIVDFYLSSPNGQGVSLMWELLSFTGIWGKSLSMIALICAFCVVCLAWFSQPISDYIYYPPLYDELHKDDPIHYGRD